MTPKMEEVKTGAHEVLETYKTVPIDEADSEDDEQKEEANLINMKIDYGEDS